MVTKANIHVYFEVNKILAIDEGDSEFSLIFEILLEWADHRLMFNFLKKDSSKNTLFKREYENIWLPEYEFSIMKDKSVDYGEKITVKRGGEPQTMDLLEPVEKYLGNESFIQIKTTVKDKFICSFGNISLYPFDTESCQIQLEYTGHYGNYVQLVPRDLVIQPSSFGDYKVIPENMNIFKIDSTTLAFNITLGRNFQSIFLVTYLPTILMNIINQATNYITSEGKYEFIVTVNITCMMVLASIYLSVSTSLPKTEMIKPVEVWLLVNLSYPFMVIIINIVLQVLSVSYINESLLKSSVSL